MSIGLGMLHAPLGGELQARQVAVGRGRGRGGRVQRVQLVQVGVHGAQQLRQRRALHEAHVRHALVQPRRRARAERFLFTTIQNFIIFIKISINCLY